MGQVAVQVAIERAQVIHSSERVMETQIRSRRVPAVSLASTKVDRRSVAETLGTSKVIDITSHGCSECRPWFAEREHPAPLLDRAGSTGGTGRQRVSAGMGAVVRPRF